jgi:hypothetical protein
VEGRVKSSLCNLKHILTDLLDARRNRPPVHRSQCQSAQDEEIQRALKKIGWFAHTQIDYSSDT